MLFYEYVILGPALLTATSVFSLVQIETKHARSLMPSPSLTNETVIEVIRNLTRVNNAMRELIKKYEQSPKIYKTKSYESSDNGSTDSEIDEQYKHKKKNRAKLHPATQITPFEDTVESSATDDDAVEETKGEGSTADAANHNGLSIIDNLHAQNKTEIKSDSAKSSVSGKTVVKEKVTMQTTSTKEPPRIIIIDTHELFKNVSKFANRPQARIVPMILHKQDTTPRQNTRFKKVDHRIVFRSGFDNDSLLSILDNSLPLANGSKNLALEESFSREKISDEVRKNKPIKVQDAAYFWNKTKKESEVIGSNPRPVKTAIRNGPEEPLSFNQRARTENQDTKNKDFDSAAEEKALDKEIFKADVLRKAYGDSCTKLVVRKCFKACKMAVKRACASSGCKSSFKESFKLHSRTGCIKHFTNVSQTEANPDPNAFRLLRTGGIANTNDEYLTAAACWPLLGTDKSIPKSNLNSTSPKPEENLNILRDRYEKACQAFSADKCGKACMYSYEEACKAKECPRKREGKFRTHCKRQCRIVYTPGISPREKSSGSSGSSGSSDSSDSSDSSGSSDSSDSSDSSGSDSS